MRTKLLILCCLFASCLVLPVWSADPPEVKTKTSMVCAFKNGIGFVVRQGKAQLADGWAMIPDVPGAAHGSLWIAANDKGASVDEIIAFQKDLPKPRAVNGLAELLAANVGGTVSVTIRDKEYTGTIVAPVLPNPEGATAPDQASLRPSPGPQSDLLILKIGDKSLAFKISEVQSVSLGDKAIWKVDDTEKAKRLKLKVRGAGESANLTMGYLEKGVSWTPSYMIALEDEKSARITMQAVLVNDVEDLADADVFFVVGFPNFAFSDVISPMALQQTLAQFISSLEGGGQQYRERYGRLSNVMTQSARVVSLDGFYDGEVPPEFSYSATEGLPGAPEEDLFLYSRQKVNLAKGERGSYVVFTDKVAYEHIYEWEIPDTSGVNSSGYVEDRRSDQTKDVKDNVWHSLRLTNSTKYPWTTAPAMVMSDTKPMSQDILNYTAKGARGSLKMTVATDISADKQETEIARQPDALRRQGRSFDAVTVEGVLKVKNYKTTNVKLSINKMLTGEMLSASDDGKARKVAESLRGVNPTTKITWEIPLKAGEEKTITYKYKVFVQV